MLHLYEDQLSNITMFAIWGIAHYLESYLMSRPIFRERILSCLSDVCKSGFHMPQNQREISSHNSLRCPTIWNHSLILMLDSTKYALQSPINYISPRWSNTYMLQQMDTFCRITEGRSGTNSSNVDDHSTEMQHHKACKFHRVEKFRSSHHIKHWHFKLWKKS